MTLTPEQLQKCAEVTEEALKFALSLPNKGLALTALLSAYATLAFASNKAEQQECATLLITVAEKLKAHKDGDLTVPAQPMQHPMPSTVQ